MIELRGVRKDYAAGGRTITAVDDCSFCVERGELAVILGPSGAGKTSVLNLIGGMDTPTCGEIYVDGSPVHAFGRKRLTEYRRSDIGFVFQFYNLVGNLTALENVELGSRLCRRRQSARVSLEQVGLSDRAGSYPAQLSGGEQQRVAIARAIAKNPKVLLCDEPTGALDSATGRRVIALLAANCREKGITTVLITHNSVIADIANRVIKIKNGTVGSEAVNGSPCSADDISW
jgi:putative ABC transport system ATP-binding protein